MRWPGNWAGSHANTLTQVADNHNPSTQKGASDLTAAAKGSGHDVRRRGGTVTPDPTAWVAAERLPMRTGQSPADSTDTPDVPELDAARGATCVCVSDDRLVASWQRGREVVAGRVVWRSLRLAGPYV